MQMGGQPKIYQWLKADDAGRADPGKTGKPEGLLSLSHIALLSNVF